MNPDIKDRLAPDEIVEVMKQYFELPSELDYYLILEFSVLSRLRGHVPNDICGYLLIHGPSGTGKSHVGQYVVEISNGDWLQAISEGALLAGVLSGKLIGIDEIDGQIRRIEATEDILRSGNIWDGKYRKMVPTEDGFKPQDIPCGGPKVLTSIGLPEEALASRCYIIEMKRSPKSHVFCVQWAYRRDDVLKIARSLDLYADDIKKNMDGDKLKEWHLSEDHLGMLHKLHNVHARRTDLANVFTTVDHLLGWDVPGILESLGKESLDEDKETLRGYLRDLRDAQIRAGADIENIGIKAIRILEEVNQRRKDACQRPLTSRTLGIAMTELGFAEPDTKVRHSDGVHYLFNSKTEALLNRGVIASGNCQDAAQSAAPMKASSF